MRNRSITLRLTLYFGVASMAVLLAIGYLVGMAVERHFVDLDRIELEGKMELISHALAKVRGPDDTAGIRERMDDALTGHPNLAVRIFTPDGRELYARGGVIKFDDSSPPFAGTNYDSVPLTSWMHDGHEYRGFTAVAHPEAMPSPGVLVTVAVSTDEHHRFMVVLYRNLWLAVAIGILSTAILGWFAARRGLTPIRDMASVARRVTASRLDDRLPVDHLPVELHELAEAYNEMLSRLGDAFRRLSEFSSDLAHELRTPIGNLITQTHVALSRTRSADEYREVLYSNSEEFDRLARMVTDMLFLAKADHGLMVPRNEHVDLVKEVNDLFEFYDAFAEDHEVSLRVDGEGMVTGDRLMLRRALSNMLSNAINHTPKHGAVSVRIATAHGKTTLWIDNPGGMIAPEHLPHLFERFYRIDSSRKRSTEGAGLGLAITKSIVTAHGGTVRAESNDERTRFEIVLPSANAGTALRAVAKNEARDAARGTA
jgi:two-component system heavy metal sensor histidine kinase CusS